jgi:hypothetical protein
MIVLSKESVRSRWVEREVNAAREREDGENTTASTTPKHGGSLPSHS